MDTKDEMGLSPLKTDSFFLNRSVDKTTPQTTKEAWPMETDAMTVSLPRYFLLNLENQPDGPNCRDYATKACTAIYGFTNQEAYEAFRASTPEPRRPYPLVSRHLSEAMARDGLSLVVLNATGVHGEVLEAATCEAILAALSCRAESVGVSYQLKPAGDLYDVQAVVLDEAGVAI